MRCPEENAAEDAAQYHLGGMILLAGIFKGKTYAQVRALTEELQQSADIPLLIGAGRGGGTVVRASEPHLRADKFSRAPGAVRCGGLSSARRCGGKSRPSCWGWASTSNFAPVCDVSTDPGDYIYPRTLGAPAEETAEYVSAVVEEMNRAGIGGVLEAFSAIE